VKKAPKKEGWKEGVLHPMAKKSVSLTLQLGGSPADNGEYDTRVFPPYADLGSDTVRTNQID
jgi:hypothetical protein